MQVLSWCRQCFEDLALEIAPRVVLRNALLDGLPIGTLRLPYCGDRSSVKAQGAQDFADILFLFAAMRRLSR